MDGGRVACRGPDHDGTRMVFRIGKSVDLATRTDTAYGRALVSIGNASGGNARLYKRPVTSSPDYEGSLIFVFLG